jgi:hypothetical protein
MYVHAPARCTHGRRHCVVFYTHAPAQRNTSSLSLCVYVRACTDTTHTWSSSLCRVLHTCTNTKKHIIIVAVCLCTCMHRHNTHMVVVFYTHAPTQKHTSSRACTDTTHTWSSSLCRVLHTEMGHLVGCTMTSMITCKYGVCVCVCVSVCVCVCVCE